MRRIAVSGGVKIFEKPAEIINGTNSSLQPKKEEPIKRDDPVWGSW